AGFLGILPHMLTSASGTGPTKLPAQLSSQLSEGLQTTSGGSTPRSFVAVRDPISAVADARRLQCSKRAPLSTISGALAGKSAAPDGGLLRLDSRLAGYAPRPVPSGPTRAAHQSNPRGSAKRTRSCERGPSTSHVGVSPQRLSRACWRSQKIGAI